MNTKTCSDCSYQNRSENKYCTQCGSRLHEESSFGPRLLVLTNDNNSIVFQVRAGRSTIGRDIGNAIIINDEQVSKYHAAVTYEKDQLWIEDLESKNGLYVNGRKMSGRVLLQNGSLIKMGTTILRFEAAQGN